MIYRTEHPRPDFKREPWQTLNGTWQFAFDMDAIGISQKWYEPTHVLDKQIQVPFCYQSSKSGIGLEELIPVVWYRRKFTVPESFRGKHTHICFGAVDYRAHVYVNGKFLACHEGGYSAFRVDVTDALTEGENDLCLCVEDYPERQQPRGKQYWKEGWKRCWYVPCTGIWQSVYMEAVEALHITNIFITPNIDDGNVSIELQLNRKPCPELYAEVDISLENKRVKRALVMLDSTHNVLNFSMLDPEGIEDIHLWTPSDPALYDVCITLRHEASDMDCVRSYFGMRKIDVKNGYIRLNNRAIYLRMVLDQGYWPDSLLTPPSEDAIKQDIEWTLKLGYNGARKHQKIEDPLYYYWADKLGLLVWGELPAAFEFSGTSVCRTANTLAEFIFRDMNHPSIIAWVPVNESWGMTRMCENRQMQEAAKMLYHECKALDPSRIVSTNDGWELVETDILGLHDYTADGDTLLGHFHAERKANYAVDSRMCYASGFVPTGNEALMVTEYGGIAMDNTGVGWGYNGKVSDEEAFFKRFSDVTDGIRKIPECRGYCYTQLTDVRQEINGILYPDRTPKVNPEHFRMLNGNPKGER